MNTSTKTDEFMHKLASHIASRPFGEVVKMAVLFACNQGKIHDHLEANKFLHAPAAEILAEGREEVNKIETMFEEFMAK